MKTEIIVIADRSGSMASTAKDAIGGYNTFLVEQQKDPVDTRLTFTQFDTEYEVVYQARPISEAPQLDSKTFVPRGSTALLDAIGRTLNQQGKRIADENWAELVIVCIITDGGENASREFTRSQIKSMTEHAQKAGWKFIYIGANQDAFSESASLGLNSVNTVTSNYSATAAGTQAMYASVSLSVSNLKRGMSPEQFNKALADKLQNVK